MFCLLRMYEQSTRKESFLTIFLFFRFRAAALNDCPYSTVNFSYRMDPGGEFR